MVATNTGNRGGVPGAAAIAFLRCGGVVQTGVIMWWWLAGGEAEEDLLQRRRRPHDIILRWRRAGQ